MNIFLVCKGLEGNWVTFHNWWRQKSNIKGGVIFSHFWLEGGMQRGIILGDNSVGSSNINEVIRAGLNSLLLFYFFRKAPKALKGTKTLRQKHKNLNK